MQSWRIIRRQSLTYAVLVVNIVHLVHSQAFLLIQFLFLKKSKNHRFMF